MLEQASTSRPRLSNASVRPSLSERRVQRSTVAEATRDFPVSKPAISKHLKVLEWPCPPRAAGRRGS